MIGSSGWWQSTRCPFWGGEFVWFSRTRLRFISRSFHVIFAQIFAFGDDALELPGYAEALQMEPGVPLDQATAATAAAAAAAAAEPADLPPAPLDATDA